MRPGRPREILTSSHKISMDNTPDGVCAYFRGRYREIRGEDEIGPSVVRFANSKRSSKSNPSMARTGSSLSLDG